MVDHQQQALAAVVIDQRGAQQRALGQVEAALHFVAEGAQLGAGGLALPEQGLLGVGVGVGLPPFAVRLGEAQAQGVVLAHQRLQGFLQQRRVQRLARRQQQRLVPVRAFAHGQFEEPLLHRGQRRFACHRALVDAAGLAAFGDGGQALHRLVLEQVARAEADAGLAGAADHLDGDDGVAAQFEEVVAEADALHLEHVLPDARQLLLHGALRGLVFLLHLAVVGLGQGLAVQLAVGAERHGRQQDELGRHHVVRQGGAQVGLEHVAQVGLIGALLHWHQVGHQLLATGAFMGDHHRFAHSGMALQAGFDLAQFDAEATDFHLVVEAAEVFDHPVLAVARQVAGAVHALASGEGVGDEAFGAQRGAAVVATGQAGAGQVQLAGHAHRHRVEARVEDMGGEVGDGLADGHAVAAFVHTGPVGDVDGRLGGAVEVEQADARQLGEDLALQFRRQGLAAADDAPEAGALGGAALFQRQLGGEGLQHGGHEVQRGDALRLDQRQQAGRVAVVAGVGHGEARADHQRPEELPH
ncbi:hypothetical protein D9M70_337690 [compost metagenome]